MNGTNGNQNDYPENALVPYPVILAASKGDPDAMKMVLQHFSGYIASLSMRKLYDERGNVERFFPLSRSIPQDSPLLFDKESGAIERRRSIRQIGYVPFVPSHAAGTP